LRLSIPSLLLYSSPATLHAAYGNQPKVHVTAENYHMIISTSGLKLNGTLKLLVSAGAVNLLRDNVDTVKKNTEILILLVRVV
jgi:hypothetical protein